MINILHIHSSLQAAALKMSGAEFNTFTAQARDHLFAGEREQLTQLLAGHKIGIIPQVVRQIVTARALFFGEMPPAIYDPDLGCTFERREHILESFRELENPGKATQPTVASLVRTITESDKRTDERLEAIITLGEIGDPRSLGPLLKALEQESDWFTSEIIMIAVSEIGEPAIEPLSKVLLEDKNPRVRGRAAYSLAAIGDPRVVEPLIKATTQDTSPEVRRMAAVYLVFCLLDHSNKTALAVDALLKALKNPTDHVRKAASEFLDAIQKALTERET